MDPEEKFPEEVVGVDETLRQRMTSLLSTAEACDDEARLHEVAVARLRARAERLRDLALEYREIMLRAAIDPEPKAEPEAT